MHRIFLVDDHPILREGLAYLLSCEEDFEVCGQAGSAAEAIRQVPEAAPDLVLMDISLPDKNGLELLKDLQTLCPRLPVLILSMHDELLYAERVVRAGASGYVMKDAGTKSMLDAVRKVLAGVVHLSDEASSHILTALSGKRNRSARTRLDRLSDREFEVFELVGKGLSAQQIAKRLFISPRTVDAHRSHIREKLGLENFQTLMRYAVRWVETGERPENDGSRIGEGCPREGEQ